MKLILFIISMYAWLPCFAMEPHLVISQEMASPLAHTSGPLDLESAISPDTEINMRRDYPLLIHRPTTCKSLKRSCKQVFWAYAVPMPLALTGLTLAIVGAHNPLLRHISFGFDGAALLWFVGWFAANYRQLENERLEYIRQYNGYRAHLKRIKNQNPLSAQEVENLLTTEEDPLLPKE